MKKIGIFAVALACLFCPGCSRAPSVGIIGSFFPGWMICLIMGGILAFVARFLLLRYHLEADVGPLAVFYPCVVIFFTCFLWFILFR